MPSADALLCRRCTHQGTLPERRRKHKCGVDGAPRSADGRRSARRRECPPRTRAAGARATGASTARPSCSLRSSRTSSAHHARRRAGVVWAARRASSGRPPRGATSGPPGHRGISSSEASVGARARRVLVAALLRATAARGKSSGESTTACVPSFHAFLKRYTTCPSSRSSRRSSASGGRAM